MVLTEVACRALSPAMNDPGTAIAVVNRHEQILSRWAAWDPADNRAPEFETVFVPSLQISDLFEDAFPAIARDGAGMVEVQVRPQQALPPRADGGGPEFKKQAQRHSRLALARAEQRLTFPDDMARLRTAAEPIRRT